MARKDKLLDVLALSMLPERARIARLASKWIGKPFPQEQAKAIIKCYFEGINGRLPELTQRLSWPGAANHGTNDDKQTASNRRGAKLDHPRAHRGTVRVGGVVGSERPTEKEAAEKKEEEHQTPASATPSA